MLRSIVMFAVVSALVSGAIASAEALQKEAEMSSTGVAAYPAPEGEKLSEDFALTVSGQTVPVYVCRVSAIPFNQVWPGYQRPVEQTELASFAYWDMTAPVDVEVVSQRPVESVAIRPSARGIQPQIEGNRIRFSLASPQQIVVEVNGWHKALHLFANPPAPAIDPDAPNVRYFGPGIHRPGQMTLESGQTVYLAGGAVVHGCMEATDATNIKILGPGILDSSEIKRSPTPFSKGNYGGSIHFSGCSQITVDGPILRDPQLWCLSAFGCSEIKIARVKQIGLWRYNADGIDICNSQNVTVKDCFVRSFDDSLAVKGLWCRTDLPTRNILFEGCVVWNDWGRALEIGAETSTPELSGITFRDCDIVRTVHIGMDIQHGDRAPVSDVTFENIRFEVDDVNWRPEIQKGRDAKYSERTDYCPKFLELIFRRGPYTHDEECGTMRNIIVRDCSISGTPMPRSSLRGFDETHDIKGVTITNLKVNGKVVKSLEEAAVDIGPFVSDVRIEAQP